MRFAFLGNFSVSYCSEVHHARSIEALGHTVTRLQEPKTSAAKIEQEALSADALIWVHTHGWNTPGIESALARIKAADIPIIAYHLDLYLPLPNRWRQYQRDPYMRQIDHWFTVDPAMADWFNANTDVYGHFLPAGVVEDECYLSDEYSPHANDVIFVGSKGYHPEWKWRPRLIDWLQRTYGSRFTHVGGDGDTGTVRGRALNAVYARSAIAVGDSLCPEFNYHRRSGPPYVSDRLFECAGRYGFSLFPYIRGLDSLGFADGETIRHYRYGDLDGLRQVIDYCLDNREECQRIRKAGHELVRSRHTYRHRWQTIINTVFT